MHIIYCSGVNKIILDQVSFCEDSKMWMIHLYIQEICFILQLKNSKEMFWNKTLNCTLSAVSQYLYTLLDRKKQTFFVNS